MQQIKQIHIIIMYKIIMSQFTTLLCYCLYHYLYAQNIIIYMKHYIN